MTNQNVALSKEFLLRQRSRLQARIDKYKDPKRIKEELLSGDVSLYTKYKQTTIVPLLNDAIIRIDNGEYGICLKCGQPIETKRLILVPAAIGCLVCIKQK